MPNFLLIRRWRNLKPDICMCIYLITYARVRIVHDKSYCVERPLHPIQAQQYCSILLTTVNNMGSTALFNFLPCITAQSLPAGVCVVKNFASLNSRL